MEWTGVVLFSSPRPGRHSHDGASRGPSIKSDGLRVMKGIQRVRPVTRSDVRYFHTDDGPDAERLSDVMKSKGIDAPAKMIAGFEGKVPVRQYEIWLGMDTVQSKR